MVEFFVKSSDEDVFRYILSESQFFSKITALKNVEHQQGILYTSRCRVSKCLLYQTETRKIFSENPSVVLLLASKIKFSKQK